MNKLFLLTSLFLCFGCGNAGNPEPTAASSRTQIADPDLPAKLIGRWEGTVDGNKYVEEWTRGCGDNYEGKSEMWSGDKIVGNETMRLTSFAGHWVFIASPDGEQVTSFKAEAPGTWLFVNEEHDFPQKISYSINGDALNVWIAGENDDASNRMNFDLKRVK
jgi:hypothetical protein